MMDQAIENLKNHRKEKKQKKIEKQEKKDKKAWLNDNQMEHAHEFNLDPDNKIHQEYSDFSRS